MSQDENQKRDSRFSSLSNVLKRRQEDKVEIADYQVGDIRAENAVIVAADGILVGDLLAPEVVVSGLVYGYVACRRLTVAPGGQIWGDVYVSTLELAPAGKINGWICTLDAGTVDLLRSKELGKGDVPDPDTLQMPVEMLERVQQSGADVESDQFESQRRSGIWRQLRSEAALALIARAEIEGTFDQRIGEALAGQDSTENGDESDAHPAQEQESLESAGAVEATDAETQEVSAEAEETAESDRQNIAEVAMLRTQLRQATAAAQKYYGELLWTRAELRAAKRGESEN